jgi:hypothetical protein
VSILKIPPFSSLGVILSYQCSNECRHCLYACSPAWNDWMDTETLEAVLSGVAKHRLFLTGIHFSGGEPFLRPDLLERAVSSAVRLGLPIDYAETNAFWCNDDAKTEEVLLRMQAAGLPAILVSASPFHSEFVPLERVERAVIAGRRIFGNEGVFLHTDFFYDQLRNADPKYTVAFEDYLEAVGMDQAALFISDQYGLIPNGRAAVDLAPLFEQKPASAFFGSVCRAELTSPHHAHIDCYGNIITGLCAGITLGDARDLDSVFAGIDLEARPLLRMLAEEGVEGLLRYAADETGYREEPEGYIAKCHLCLDIRRHLIRSGHAFSELAPVEFYERLSD